MNCFRFIFLIYFFSIHSNLCPAITAADHQIPTPPEILLQTQKASLAELVNPNTKIEKRELAVWQFLMDEDTLSSVLNQTLDNDPTVKNTFGTYNLLHWAVYYGYDKLVKGLTIAKKDGAFMFCDKEYNSTTSKGWTALHLAAHQHCQYTTNNTLDYLLLSKRFTTQTIQRKNCGFTILDMLVLGLESLCNQKQTMEQRKAITQADKNVQQAALRKLELLSTQITRSIQTIVMNQTLHDALMYETNSLGLTPRIMVYARLSTATSQHFDTWIDNYHTIRASKKQPQVGTMPALAMVAQQPPAKQPQAAEIKLPKLVTHWFKLPVELLVRGTLSSSASAPTLPTNSASSSSSTMQPKRLSLPIIPKLALDTIPLSS